MKLIINKLIPLNGYFAMTLWPFIFCKGEPTDITIRHETIHGKQQVEMLLIFFYIWYCIEHLVKLIIYKGNTRKAYRSISFEREAYLYQNDDEYLKNRKYYSWIKYIFLKTR